MNSTDSSLPMTKKLAGATRWLQLLQTNQSLANGMNTALAKSPIHIEGAQVLQVAAVLGRSPMQCVDMLIAARLSSTIEGLPLGPQRTQLQVALEQFQRTQPGDVADGPPLAWPAKHLKSENDLAPANRIEPDTIYSFAKGDASMGPIATMRTVLAKAFAAGDRRPAYIDAYVKNLQTGVVSRAPIQVVSGIQLLNNGNHQLVFLHEPTASDPPGLRSINDVLGSPKGFEIQRVEFSLAGFPSRMQSPAPRASKAFANSIMPEAQWIQKLSPFYANNPKATQRALQSLYRNASGPFSGVVKNNRFPNELEALFEQGEIGYSSHGIATVKDSAGDVHVYEAIFAPSLQVSRGETHPSMDLSLRLYDSDKNLVTNPPAGEMRFFGNVQRTARQVELTMHQTHVLENATIAQSIAMRNLDASVGAVIATWALAHATQAAGLTEAEGALYEFLVAHNLSDAQAMALFEQKLRQAYSADSPYAQAMLTPENFAQLKQGMLTKFASNLDFDQSNYLLAQALHDYKTRVLNLQKRVQPTTPDETDDLRLGAERFNTQKILQSVLPEQVKKIKTQYELDEHNTKMLYAIAETMWSDTDLKNLLDRQHIALGQVHLLAARLKIEPSLNLQNKINTIKALLLPSYEPYLNRN